MYQLKCLRAVLLLCVCFLMVFIIFNQQLIISFEDELLIVPLRESNTRYTINTPGCKIPFFEANSNEISEYIYTPKSFNCTNGTQPLLDANKTAVYVLPASYKYYNIKGPESFTCKYKSFWSAFNEKIVYKKKWTYFNGSATITDEFIIVNCSTPIGHYVDYFSFVQVKHSYYSNEASNNMSVMVIGFDAIPRLNFHRQLSGTIDFLLKNMSAVEMFGYNKVADNTFPNLMPVLSGSTVEELQNSCWPSYDSVFDNCSFVWSPFEKAGYLTAFGEDATDMGLFTYTRQGFRINPTHYYYRTFSKESERKLGWNKDGNAYMCMGRRLSFQPMWKYVCSFMETLKSTPYFAFFWETIISHDYVNHPSLGAAMYEKSIEYLYKSGHLENTVLIIMSDHGLRWGGIRNTNQGSYEDRLPGLFIALPEFYRKQFPHLQENLKRNAQVLTTPFNLHETLKDLVDPYKLTASFIENRNKNKTPQSKYSLFDIIPDTRNCMDANIPTQWCTCRDSVQIDKNDTNAIKVVEFVLNSINSDMSNHTDCAKLQLAEIISADRELTFSDSILTDKPEVYQVRFSATPGGGIFEAVVKTKVNQNNETLFEMGGGISRLNLYGNQSHCVIENHLKTICFCLN